MSSSDPRRGDLFIIAAPSGGGKTSLVNALLENDERLVLSISHTTRRARPGEVDGMHYHFVSHDDFEQMVENGDFLEHARVFDNHYGSNRNSVARQLEQGKDVILEIDWQGARQVRAAFPDCLMIFIIPPSLETLRERLTGRGQDSAAVIQRRMRDAQAEISHWAEFDQLVVNDDFDAALEELRTIINDYRKRQALVVNKRHQRLAQELGRS
jgi:guanylate kinase